MEKIYFSFDDIKNKLDAIKDNEFEEYETILCITRGGLIPAGLVAYKTGIKKIISVNVSAYDADDNLGNVKISELSSRDVNYLRDNYKKILIVDDIIDTGATLKKLLDYLTDLRITNCDIFTLLNKSDINIKTISLFEYNNTNKDKWIVFPWDK